MFFEVYGDLTDHTLSPGCHGQKNLNLGIFYLNYQPNQDKYLISDLFFEKKIKCKWFKKHLNKHPSSSSLKLNQMPALPPFQRELFMFSLQVTLSLSVRQWVVSWGCLCWCFSLCPLCHSSSTATVVAWGYQGHGIGCPWSTTGRDPFSLVPQAWSTITGFSMSESVQLEPSVVWNTLVQSSQTRNEDGSCIFHHCAWGWMPAPKGADICRVNYHGWDSEEGPRVRMQRGWTVVFMLQLLSGLGMGSRHQGLCPPAPAVQRLQFVLSVKAPDSCKAVPCPQCWHRRMAACCHCLFCDLLC